MPAHRTTGHVNALIDAGISMFGLVMGRRPGGLDGVDGLGGKAPVWGARGAIETSVGLAPRLAGILSSGVDRWFSLAPVPWKQVAWPCKKRVQGSMTGEVSQ